MCSPFPSDYVQNPKKYSDTLFICKIDKWLADSPFPFGYVYDKGNAPLCIPLSTHLPSHNIYIHVHVHVLLLPPPPLITLYALTNLSTHSTLMRSMGEAGEIEPETETFLIENEVDFCEFPDEALDCLPKNLPWSIPKVLHAVLLRHVVW